MQSTYLLKTTRYFKFDQKKKMYKKLPVKIVLRDVLVFGLKTSKSRILARKLSKKSVSILIVVIILQLKFTTGILKVIVGWYYCQCFCSGNHQPWNWYLHIFPYLFSCLPLFFFCSPSNSPAVDCCECVSSPKPRIRFISLPEFYVRAFFVIFTLN